METCDPIHHPPNVAMAFSEARITPSEIIIPDDPAPSTGARLDFLGIVRPTEDARPIQAIDYSHHPTLAQRELERIIAEAATAHPLLGVRLIHRVGVVAAGQPSLFVRIDTAHRAPAYDSSRWIIEQLKLRVPIWKHPVFDQSKIENRKSKIT